MSLHAVLWAFDQDLKPMPKLVLAVIASFANKDTCACFPTIATIARMASVSRRSVQRSTTFLCERELLRKKPYAKDHVTMANVYWLPCGKEIRTKSRDVSADTGGGANAGRTDNHYLNHYLRDQTRAKGLEGAQVARQKGREANFVRSTTATVDQEAGNELARRLGKDGWLILMEFPEEIARLSALLRKRALTDNALADLRLRFLQRQQSGEKHGA